MSNYPRCTSRQFDPPTALIRRGPHLPAARLLRHFWVRPSGVYECRGD